MSFGVFERGDSLFKNTYAGIAEVIGTREPFPSDDGELTEDPYGNSSGGSTDWATWAHNAFVETFGSDSSINARDAITTFNPTLVTSYGLQTLSYGPNGQEEFVFKVAKMNDGTIWYDLDFDNTYETHLIDTGNGMYIDLDFNGAYETSFVDFV